LGKTYLKLERYDEAGQYLRLAWDINPNIPELKYDLAYLNFKTDNYSRSADLFSEICEETPSNVLAQYYAGISFYKQEKYNQALDYFVYAAEKSPSIKVNGNYYAGLCYLKDGQTDKAVETLTYVKENAESEVLRNNASNWLSAIEKQREAYKPYSLYLKMGLGYDSNVPLEPVDQDFFADEDDYFAAGYFSGNYDFISKAHYRFGAGFSQYQRSYFNLTDYDLTGSIFYVHATCLFRPFSLRLAYVPTYYWLGYDSYLRSHQIIPELNWRVNQNLYSTLTYSYAQNTFFQDSDRSGHTNNVFANAYYSLDNKRASIFGGTGYEDNKASSSDQDYGLLTARLGVSFLFPWQILSSVTVRYIDKKFGSDDPYYGVQRHDKKYGGSFNLYRETYFDWLGIDFQFDYINSDSNINDYDYKRSVFTLSLKARF
jgi:tetratricopeptide (TPR) repeat protein